MANKILIVDDSKFARSMIQAPLDQAGYQVTTAGSPTEALSAIARNRPDLIISDLRMPTLVEGVGFLQMLSKESKSTPVMVCTADPNAETEIGDMGFETMVFMSKPTPPRLLKKKVRELIGV